MMIPWTLPPGFLEMPSDFASRLAARNCRDDLHDFCRDFGLEVQGLVDGRTEVIVQLANLAGIDAQAIWREAFVRIGRERRYLHKGHEFLASNLSRDRVRVCPACLEEDVSRHDFRAVARPHRRSSWLIEYVRTCPHHGLALVPVGTGSAVARRHDTSQVLATALPELGTLARQTVRREPSSFEAYVLGRLDGSGTPVAWPDGLPLHGVMRLSAMVGGSAIRGPQVAIDSLTDPERWEAEAVGFEILAGGETEIFAFLDRLQSSFLDGHVRHGPHPLFGHLYEWLAHQTDDPAYDPMRKLMWRHAVETLPIGPGDKLFGRDVPSRKLHSVRSAALEHGLHPKRTRRLLRDGGMIDAASDRLADDRVVVDAGAADRLLCGMAGTMSQEAAARHLALSRTHFMLLVKGGVIRPWIAGAQRERNHAFRQVDLEAFRTELLTAVKPGLETSGTCVDIPAAAKRACCSLAQIVRLIIDGRLQSVGVREGVKGLGALVVDVEEVRTLVHGEDHGGLTLRDVERELHTSTRAVRALVRERLLPVEMVKNPVRRQRQPIVRRDALAEFQRQYVSLQALARERGIGHLALKRVLNLEGVLPVRDPNALHLTLYRRADVS
ncbi:TniQ family protein [Xanthobacter sediminis]